MTGPPPPAPDEARQRPTPPDSSGGRAIAPDDVRELYALWAPTYSSAAHNALMRSEQEVVAPILRSHRPVRALDVGTGSGRYLPELRRAGARLVVGLDFCQGMLRRAGALGACVGGDARRVPFAASSFDLINASLVAGDIADLSAWLRGLASVLQPGGHLVYSDFHPRWQQHGWQRTFTTLDGATVDLPFVGHAIEEHWAGLRSAGLRMLACREVPLAGEHEPEATFRRRWGNPPVLVVVHARRLEK